MSGFKAFTRGLLGVLFVVAGSNHFVRPGFYIQIMPPYLPWHRELVLISGACEVVLGVLLLIPRTQAAAAWGMIALLIAVFPANVHMAMNPELFASIPPIVLYLRLPLQAVLIAWAWWYTRDRDANPDYASAGER